MVGRQLVVRSLWRYPVKSMLGEQCPVAWVGRQGLAGDRTLAVVDRTTGRVASAKQPRLWRALLSAMAVHVDGAVSIRLPGQPPLAADDEDVHDRLSNFLGRPVELSARPEGGAAVERADPEEVLDRGVAALVTAPALELGGAVPGPSFLDYAPLHLITTATLARLGSEAPRYRPNLVVQTPPGFPAFEENRWVDGNLSVGDGVLLRVVLPTPRCSVPTLAHGELPPDPQALRVLMQSNRVDVPGFGVLPVAGVYATVLRPGQLECGSTVTLAPPDL